jgi:hypothetical protein
MSVVHMLLSSQLRAAPLVQVPAVQTSPVVHMLLSSQAVPSALAGFEHVPEAGSQVPTSWQVSAAAQVTGLPPVQVPAMHTSERVHMLLSLHAVPSALAGAFEHIPVAGSHVPASWHESGAMQVTAVPPVQVPVWHASPVVHRLPSSQVVPLALT